MFSKPKIPPVKSGPLPATQADAATDSSRFSARRRFVPQGVTSRPSMVPPNLTGVGKRRILGGGS